MSEEKKPAVKKEGVAKFKDEKSIVEREALDEKAQAQADRRAERKEMFKEKLIIARDRLKHAHGTAITKSMLKDYVDFCHKQEIYGVLEGKLGRIMGTDREIMLELLKELE